MKRLIPFLTFSALQAQTVTLTPVKDTDVYSFPGNGKPTSSIVSLGVSSTPPGEGIHSQRSLIQFDVSALPFPASEIESAVLRLFVLPTDPTYGNLSPGDVHVHRQGTNWGTVTLSTPTWLAFQSAQKLGKFHVGAGSQESWLQFEMTGCVTAWADGTHANHGIYLAPEADVMDTPINVSFTSMEVPGYQPQLVITRRSPVLEIFTTSTTATLRWPVAGSEGWTLQRSRDLLSDWTNHTTAISASGGHWQVQLPVTSREFFRLIRN